jgi:hypothetical protein
MLYCRPNISSLVQFVLKCRNNSVYARRKEFEVLLVMSGVFQVTWPPLGIWPFGISPSATDHQSTRSRNWETTKLGGRELPEATFFVTGE